MLTATIHLARCCWMSRNSWSWRNFWPWRKTEHVCGQLWSIKFSVLGGLSNKPWSRACYQSKQSCASLSYFLSAYFHDVHIRCTLLRQKADGMSRSRREEANRYRFVPYDSSRSSNRLVKIGKISTNSYL